MVKDSELCIGTVYWKMHIWANILCNTSEYNNQILSYSVMYMCCC